MRILMVPVAATVVVIAHEIAGVTTVTPESSSRSTALGPQVGAS